MFVDVGWINVEETVIAFNLRGNWTTGQFYLAADKLSNLVQEKNYSVHLIIDLSYSTVVPSNLLTIFRMGFKKFPPEIEQAIIIVKSGFWQRLFLMLDSADLVPFPFQFVENADEAYKILEKYLL
jgi:hypothetical protein